MGGFSESKGIKHGKLRFEDVFTQVINNISLLKNTILTKKVEQQKKKKKKKKKDEKKEAKKFRILFRILGFLLQLSSMELYTRLILLFINSSFIDSFS
jgi:hypothetical protein